MFYNDNMEKQDNHYKSYKPLSKLESALLDKVATLIVFSLSDVRNLTKWKHSTISNVLFSLKKKKVLTAVKKDNYVLSERIPEHILTIAASVNLPSYISLWTACSYYGLTEQQVKTIQLVSTKQYCQHKIFNHSIEIITLLPKKWFGYHRVNNIPIAEIEKLLIDCAYKPEKAGGTDELRKCISNAWPQINIKKLRRYLQMFNNKSLFARLGYLIEELHLPNTEQAFFLRRIPKGYTLLNPSKKNPNEQTIKKNNYKYNHKWRIVIND